MPSLRVARAAAAILAALLMPLHAPANPEGDTAKKADELVEKIVAAEAERRDLRSVDADGDGAAGGRHRLRVNRYLKSYSVPASALLSHRGGASATNVTRPFCASRTNRG